MMYQRAGSYTLNNNDVTRNESRTMSERPAAGWYPAAHANGELRRWDGERWMEPEASRVGLPWWVSALIAGFVLVIGFMVFGMWNAAQEPSEASVADAGYSSAEVEIPDGFTDGGAGVAARWATPDESLECPSFWSACATAMIYAYESCDVYMKVNILDADGIVVGWTNDTVGFVRAGEYAKAQFHTAEESAVEFEFTQGRCY